MQTGRQSQTVKKSLRKKLIEGQHFSDWRKDMRKQRKELEDGY